jgi:diguanylate cyclase (GGDEF)-like protein/PAS domain S-box-containing protein
MLAAIGAIWSTHDPYLLALAGFVCLIACFSTLSLQSRASAGRQIAWYWPMAAGVVFGCGVWATHFIAMLASQPAMGFALSPTLLSIVIAILGGAAAFLVLGSRGGVAPAAIAGVMLGLTVAGMHFVGMGAMRLPDGYSVATDTASAAIVAGTVLTTLVTVGVRNLQSLFYRLLGAAGLSAAILVLHFTGMAALVMNPGSAPAGDGATISPTSLAVSVAAVSFSIVLLSLAIALFHQHLSARQMQETIRLRQIAGTTFEGIIIERHGIIIDVNDIMCELIGSAADRLVGCPVSAIAMPGDGTAMTAHLAGQTTGSVELRLQTSDGTARPVEMQSRAIDYNGAASTVIAIRDLSARKHAEEKLQHFAHHDPLTGLANSVRFNERLTHALLQMERTPGSLAVLSLDLDRFKMANELLGYAGGNKLLIEVAQRVRSVTGPLDTAARLGGDELAIVQLSADQPKDAAELAARLVEALAAPFQIDGQTIEIGVSIGVAVCPADGRTASTLLRHADLALSRAKLEGRGMFHFFEAAMDRRHRDRRAMQVDLRQAIENGEISLHYQRLLDFATDTTVGFEALARWHHPARGPVSPVDFIPLAEETGLILPLGRWVLQTACREAASWKGQRLLAVNLSPAQFRQPDLPEMVATILQQSGLPPERLELEVTEGLLIDDTERAVTMLNALKDQGIRISLDDFGTGYSSLSYLRKFPFDKIKIDKSFVQGLGVDKDADAIVGVVIALARSLKLQVIAEGIETQAQFDLLRKLGCDQGQGFLIGRPVAFDHAMEENKVLAMPGVIRGP